jgi:Dihydrodipicolinate synthase/N-acetylneuraminate lyase
MMESVKSQAEGCVMRLEGVVTAAVTPLTHDGAALASEAVFASYYRFLLQHDISGVFIAGTTGEGMVLSLAERQRVCELAAALIGPHKPVLVNVGSASTAEAVTLARHAAQAGVDAVAVIAPYFLPAGRSGHAGALSRPWPTLFQPRLSICTTCQLLLATRSHQRLSPSCAALALTWLA